MKRLFLILLFANLVFADPIPIPHPAGNDTEVQYNKNGVFYGDPNFTFEDVNNILTVDDVNIPSMFLGDSTYRTVNDFFKIFTSAGRISGGDITDAGGETIDVNSGTGLIRILDDDVSQVKFFVWDANNGISIPTDTIRYVGVEYNGGSPQVIVKTSETWDLDTEFPLGEIINENGTLHILNNYWWVSDGLTNVIERLDAFGHAVRDEHYGGLAIGVDGVRSVTVTAGKIWSRLNEFDITALTIADNFEYYWYNGVAGTWNVSDTNQYSVTQWNDTSLATLQNIQANRYAVIWVYAEPEDDEIALIYPQAEYVVYANAEAEQPSSILPDHILHHGVRLGRIIIKQNQDSPEAVESAFDMMFTSLTASTHNNLAGLQGGELGYYYHHNSSDYTEITEWIDDVNLGSDGSITTTGDVNAINIYGANIDWDTAYTHSQDNTQAHSDYLLNTGDTASGDYNFGSGAFYIDDTNNYIGIGTDSPLMNLHILASGSGVSSSLYSDEKVLISGSDESLSFGGITAGTHSWDRMIFKSVRARGTPTSPSRASDGDSVFSLLGEAYDGSARRGTASIEFTLSGTTAASQMPQKIQIRTGATTSRSDRIVVMPNGEVFMPDVYSDDVGAVRDLLIKSDGQLGYNSSSIRYKENVKDYNDISGIFRLRPVEYDRKDGSVTGEKGLIAEEVRDANVNIPNLVSYKRVETTIIPENPEESYERTFEDTDIPETVNYSRLIVPLLKAVQDQQKKIEELEARIEALER